MHSNVWGLAPIDSLFGYRYFVSFVNDYSRCIWIYLLKSKGDVFLIFVSYHNMIEIQFDKKKRYCVVIIGVNTFSLHLVPT